MTAVTAVRRWRATATARSSGEKEGDERQEADGAGRGASTTVEDVVCGQFAAVQWAVQSAWATKDTQS